MLHSPFSMYPCFPLGTVKSCFVSERVTRADPKTVRFDEISKFWATILIQILLTLSHKFGQQSTLFEFFSKHCSAFNTLCRKRQQTASHKSSFPPFHTIPCRCLVFHVVFLLGLKVFGVQKENLCIEPSMKSPSSLNIIFSVSSKPSTIKIIMLQNRQS